MYKFKSRATADLLMLEPGGRLILSIIGKDQGESLAQGILLPADMPAAMRALHAAVDKDEQRRAQLQQQARDKGEPEPRFEGISLRQRAWPFLDMLERSYREEREIVWGV